MRPFIWLGSCEADISQEALFRSPTKGQPRLQKGSPISRKKRPLISARIGLASHPSPIERSCFDGLAEREKRPRAEGLYRGSATRKGGASITQTTHPSRDSTRAIQHNSCVLASWGARGDHCPDLAQRSPPRDRAMRSQRDGGEIARSRITNRLRGINPGMRRRQDLNTTTPSLLVWRFGILCRGFAHGI